MLVLFIFPALLQKRVFILPWNLPKSLPVLAILCFCESTEIWLFHPLTS